MFHPFLYGYLMQWTHCVAYYQIFSHSNVQCYLAAEHCGQVVMFSYLYFMPVLMLCSLDEGALWTDSCPRLRATMATARNLPRVPLLGLLVFC